MKDPNYYHHIDEKVLATQLGKISLYAELTILAVEPFIGVIFDTFGRKIPIIFGFFVMASAIATVPVFHEIYPWYCLN